MSGINGSITINFNNKLPVEFEVHSFSSNTLRISNFSEDSMSSMYLYLSATPEQFRQIGEECIAFAEKLEAKKKEEIALNIKEDTAA